MKKYIFLLFVTLNVHAAPLCKNLFEVNTDYLFGLEFTFTNQTIVDEGNRNPADGSLVNNPIKAIAWQKWLEIVKAKCKRNKRCTTTMSADKHGAALAVRFDDGFQFTIGIDSAALEVNATPKTRTGFADVKERLREYAFKTAAQAGLTPH